MSISNDKHKYDESSESEFAFMKRVKIPRADGARYIDRFIIIRCKLGSIMFHRIFSTDNDCMHDHPWSFRTLIIKGGYFEHVPKYGPKMMEDLGTKLSTAFWGHIADVSNKTWYKPGSWMFRPAKYVHRLEIPEGKQAWTLVFTGPEKRVWGFHTPLGWVGWRGYKNVGSCL